MDETLRPFGLSKTQLLAIYEMMVRIRKFEDKVSELYKAGKAPGFIHSYVGEEAIAAGICANLRNNDYITSTHRAEGHCLAKGMSPSKVMAEILGKVDGCCKGKSGSMHFADAKCGMLGATGIVGSLIPVATGAALSAKLRHTDQVAVAFFGDGAVANAAFHESVNFAAIWDLPVIFVCENNWYSTATPFRTAMKNTDVMNRAQSYGIFASKVDGMDALAVFKAGQEAVDRARNRKGATLLECETYRFLGHYIGDIDTRPRDENEEWLNKDPIKKLGTRLIAENVATTEELQDINNRMDTEVRDAADFAIASPFPPVEEGLKDVFADYSLEEIPEIAPGERQLTMRDAINEAMKQEMSMDPTVILYGQGYVNHRGGPYQVGKNLQEMFGKDRVRDSPISELAMAGLAIGAAMTGLRPIVEIQYIDFVTLSMDQLVNQAGKIRYLSGGQFNVPMVLRTTCGAFANSGPHHSQSLEGWFIHVPGLKVIMPSTPYDAKGLLKAAIRDNDPCLFFEPKALYSFKGPVPEEDYIIPLGKADVKKQGSDLTIITWSRMVHPSLAIAKKLEAEDMRLEVVDLRTLMPLDKQTILESVKKTGRVLLVYEAYKTGGVGAEISAIINEEIFDRVKAPIKRVANPDVPVPFSPSLENFVLPNEASIEKAARELLKDACRS
jgi:pyruvate/2-oxoglutarate/acetoin dehydrogenase E1 component/TPP-dependent pyruvate/acetoin dehydrogenase alpha subunit